MNPQQVLALIRERASARGPFNENRAIDPAVLDEILQAAAWSPTAHNMQNFELVVVQDKAVLRELSELESSVSPVFVRENYRQLSFSDAELRAKKTGLLAAQFPPEWLTTEAQAGRLPAEPPAKLGEQVRRGPALAVVLYDPARRAPASEGDFLGAMSLGCVLENMWLMATARGVGFHIISSLANEPLASEVKKTLGIPERLAVALSVRLGYPALAEQPQRPRERVRRDVADFVSLDRYRARGEAGEPIPRG
ncbi:MAG: nitroreductase family protein [Actinomycetia bacterium]|nr:nitroreductase family protein [Actinomycetes bacterium]